MRIGILLIFSKLYLIIVLPCKPVITGPNSARINKPYTINISTVDPEGDNIYYFVIVWSGWC